MEANERPLRIWVSLNRDIPPYAHESLTKMGEVLFRDEALLEGSVVAIIGSLVDASADFMERAGASLMAIVRPGIGVDNIDLQAATERGILIINTPDAPTESTAEHAVALLLSAAKKVVAGDRSLRGTSIPRLDLFGTEVRNRVLGVVGFGRIGKRVAEICALGLKMQVIVYDPFLDPAQLPAVGYDFEEVETLEALLERSDFVTLHTPLTRKTHRMIGAKELQRMKKGACLINSSRGQVVDESALIEALQSGHVGGAGLDVFDPEPPDPKNPLFQFTNVVLTPHIGASTDTAERAMWDSAVSQTGLLLSGERPPHLVNPEAWPGRAGPGSRAVG